MRASSPARPVLRGAQVLGAGAAALSFLSAQEVEPRIYSNAPVGVNFLITGYGYTDGGLSFDPSLPLKDPQLHTSSLLLAYARVLDLGGRSAKLDVVAPYTWLSGTAHLGDGTVARNVDGFMDPRVRLSVNLVGAPALSLKDFRNYRQDLLVGVSLQVSVPGGQYDDTRLVNIGSHRWTFKPEVGVSKARGAWTLEGAAGITFFPTNPDFYGGRTRAQDPLYSAQGNVVYSFSPGIWAALGATYFTGGATTLNDTGKNDRQDNWRLGGTLALPVNARNSVKLAVSNGVSARTGNNFFMAGVAWQLRWGGGV